MPPFDRFAPEFLSDPYAAYARYRRDDPIHDSRADGLWYLFKHADIRALFGDSRVSNVFDEGSAEIPAEHAPFVEWWQGNNFWLSDPPDHTRVRSLIHLAFTPKVVRDLRPRIERLAHALVDPLRDRGRFDVMAEFAWTLPLMVIAELVGVPIEARNDLRRWTMDFAPALNFVESDAETDRLRTVASRAVTEFVALLRDLLDARRRGPADDLISGLAKAEERGVRLSDDEIIGACILLLFAGHETTQHLIGNGLHALFTHPDQLERLLADLDAMESAVHEMLRFNGPTQFMGRRVTEPIELRGVTLPEGAWVEAVLTSANRDEEIFADPDRFDIARGAKNYLSFGSGIHYCLGSPLAKLETEIALRALFERLPNLRPTEGQHLVWRRPNEVYGLTAYELEFDPA